MAEIRQPTESVAAVRLERIEADRCVGGLGVSRGAVIRRGGR